MPLRSGRGTADIPFHVMNRGARRLELFETPTDYRAFLFCLAESLEKIPVRLLAYCLMPNHFHLVAVPRKDGELSVFMKHLEWPSPRPSDWLQTVNAGENLQDLRALRRTAARECPFGTTEWASVVAKAQGVTHKLRPRGRPTGKTVGRLFP